MDLRGYLRAIRASWWIVVLVAVLGLVSGAYDVSRTGPIYAGHVTFFVNSPTSSTANSVSSNLTAAEDLAVSYAQLLSSDRLGDSVAKSDPAIKLTGSQVAAKISGAAQLNTVLINATIRDSSRTRLVLVTNAVAISFPKMIAAMSTSDSPTALEVTSGPTVSKGPVSPHKKLVWGLGLLVGLLIGIGIAVIRALFDTSIRTAEHVRELTGLPVIGSIPFDPSAKRSPALLASDLHSVRAEAIRQLRTNLQFIDVSGPLGVIMVTSAVVMEGKSSTTTNLALMFAESGRSVLLIEADMRRPRVAQYLGMIGSIGLSDVIARRAELDDVLQVWGDTSLTLLAGGTTPPNPSELLDSPRMTALLDTLRTRFDLIIIDTPPLLPVTDAAVLATRTDGVVIVCRYARTKRNQLREAAHSLVAVNARVIGVVLNMAPGKTPYTYGAAANGGDVTPPNSFTPSSAAPSGSSHNSPLPDHRAIEDRPVENLSAPNGSGANGAGLSSSSGSAQRPEVAINESVNGSANGALHPPTNGSSNGAPERVDSGVLISTPRSIRRARRW